MTAVPSSFDAALDPIGDWIADGTLARAAALVLVGGQKVAERYWGTAADGRPLDSDTLFPFASLTKPTLTTAILRLVDRGALSLDRTVGETIPDAPVATRSITIAQLLTHTAGFPELLPGVHELEQRAAPGEAYVRAALDCAPAFPPGTRVLYSNPGFQVLGHLLERALGVPVPDLVDREALGPAGMTRSTMRPLDRPGARTARIELGGGRPAGARNEIYNSAYFKRLARADAGLFAPPADIARLLELYRLGGRAGDREVLRPATARDALTSHTAGLPGRYGPYEWASCDFGWSWELKADKAPHPTGPRTSPRTFGHIGGAGALALCDPDRALTVVVHTCRDFSDGWARERPYLTRVVSALVEAADG